MMAGATNCPLCRCADVRLVGQSDDGLHSYRCHDCAHVFHVTTAQDDDAPRAQETVTPDKAVRRVRAGTPR